MQRIGTKAIVALIVIILSYSCNTPQTQERKNQPQITKDLTAKQILENPDYLAISYGGYRKNSRDIQPTLAQIKEDMKILAAMNIKILRTYNVQLKQASTLLEAIHQLKKEDPSFEMYVMLGAWIDCQNAWTDQAPNHDIESEQNAGEIDRAVALAKKYPAIVKIIAVGNEAMVKWATSYYVQAGVILKWVNHLQDLKKKGELPEDLWVTCSDNFASWGGGDPVYHTEDLTRLVKAVDYVSLHTYPMHDTHYHPIFWGITQEEESLAHLDKIDAAMERAKQYAISQYENTSNYIKSLGIYKPIHIGETGWASSSNSHYSPSGSKATDEYKEAKYYDLMREWTKNKGIACFYFEAFDEPWKDAQNPGGSENHFGLFTVEGQAKYALWKMVDLGTFKGLNRGGNTISKTYYGNKNTLLKDVLVPPVKEALFSN